MRLFAVLILLLSILKHSESVGVRLWQHCCWHGWRRDFGSGRWHTSHFPNDDASSIQVWSNTRVKMYEHQCGGRTITWTHGNYCCFTSWGFNDVLSCMDVSPVEVSCPAGRYNDGSNNCHNCPAGKYRGSSGGKGSGSCSNCNAGRYGSSTGHTSSNCNGACSKGHYCPAGSTSSTQHDCPAGRYGSSTGLGNSNCNGVCSAGSYCNAGSTSSTQHACNAGRWGNTGQSKSSCSGACPAGRYCPSRTGTSQPACGGIQYYCPGSASSRSTVPSGYYSTPTSASTSLRTGFAECPVGHYCSGGKLTACPSGRFGSSKRVSSSSCSGACTAGYFCPAGSTGSKAQSCGTGTKPANYYCPEGTSSRNTVPSGHYSTPENAPAQFRTGYSACPAGFTCSDGLKARNMVFDSGCLGQDAVSEGSFATSESASVNDAVGTAITARSVASGGATSFVLQSQTCTKRPNSALTAPSDPFKLQSSTGTTTVQVKAALNHEACSEYVLRLKAAAGSDSALCDVRVEVTDTNEQPWFGAASYSRTVEEGVEENAPVEGSPVLANDVEEASGLQSVTYALTVNPHGIFRVRSCSGELSVAKPQLLDHETTPFYDLQLTATDDGSPQLSATVPLRINIRDRNDPPVVTDQLFTVAENSAVGAFVGTVAATDPEGRAMTYTITRKAVPDVFSINPSTGQIAVAVASLDYEAILIDPKRLTMDVTVTDDGGEFAVSVVSVDVTDTNDDPVLTVSDVGLSVAENSGAGQAVGFVSATDQDAGTVFTFGLSDDAGGRFTIDPDTGDITVAAAGAAGGPGLDFETAPSLPVTITVNDNSGAVVSVTETVNVVDVNERPVVSSASITVRELTDLNTALVPALTWFDPDNAGPHTDRQRMFFTITAADPDMHFRMDETGAVVVAAPLDFEDVAAYTLTVTAEDSGSPAMTSAPATVNVTVLNDNEPPTFPAQQGGVDENSSPGTAVEGGTAVTCDDPDIGGTDGMTFVITDLGGAVFEDGAGNEQPLFVLAPSTSVLSVAPGVTDLNLEAETNTWSLVITCTDSGGLTATGEYSLYLQDVQEDPWFPDQTRSVPELAPAGSRVGSPVKGADEDFGQAHTLTYSILSQPSPDRYDINATSGQLSLVRDAPLHTAADETVQIGVEDIEGLTGSGTVTIQWVDRNNPPTLDDFSINVPEDTEMDTIIVSAFAGSDPDVASDGQSLSYLVTDAQPFGSQAQFLIVNVNQLRLLAQLDFESVNIYRLQLRVEDDGPGNLEDTAWLTINVVDVPETPVIAMHDDGADMTVGENAAAGTQVLNSRIDGFDPDVEDNVAPNTLQFSIALDDSVHDPASVANPFTLEYLDLSDDISAAGGGTSHAVVIKVAAGAALDYEAIPTYSIVLTVTDTTDQTASMPATIALVNVNEPVTFTPGQAADLPEDVAVGDDVLELAATDPDAGTSPTFTITSGNTNDAFAIRDGTTLTVARPLDFEDVQSYTLGIRVVDALGDPEQTSDDGTVVVTILNIDDVELLSFGPGSDLHDTAGGESVVLTGTNLGYSGDAVSNRGVTQATPVVTYASAVNPGLAFTATDCQVTTPGTAVTCKTAPGVGSNLVWTVEMRDGDSDSSAVLGGASSSETTSYRGPVVTAVSTTSGGDSPTSGGASVTVTGTGFGTAATTAAGALDWVEYAVAQRYVAANCVVVSNTQVTCETVAGVGRQHQWRLSVAGQESDWSSSADDATSSYRPPVVTGVSITASSAGPASSLPTVGGTAVTVTGSDLGPVLESGLPLDQATALASLSVKYGHPDVDETQWFTATCSVSAAHTELACVTAPGVGADLAWRVTLADQSSPMSAAAPAAIRLSYTPPTLVAVSGAGAVGAATPGGEVFVLRGSNLGPAANNAPFQPFIPDPIVTYGRSGTEFTAASCTVTEPHSELTCVTAPGTGKGLSVYTVIGAQRSELLLPDISGVIGMSYAPPSVSSFSLVGAVDADTAGGQAVRVHGNDFGFDTAMLEGVWYSMPDGDVGDHPQTFVAAACTITTAHVAVDCLTVPGAGDELDWVLQVDGQNSSAPLTNYKAPEVTAVTLEDGSPAVDLSTDGGDVVVLHGTNFGPPGKQFLRWVRYGPGNVFECADPVHESHTRVTCTTSPGQGADLRFTIKVGNQESARSGAPARLSYAPPTISAVQPDVVNTWGGDVVTLTGANFALLSETAVVQVVFGNEGDNTLLPPDAWLAVDNESPRFGATLPDPYDGTHSLTFRVPAGLGGRRAVRVAVTDATSGVAVVGNPVAMAFASPSLDRVNVKPLPGTDDVELRLLGSNFGPPQQFIGSPPVGDGVLRQVWMRKRLESFQIDPDHEGGDFTPSAGTIMSWTHNEIVVHSPFSYGDLQIRVTSADFDDDDTVTVTVTSREYLFTGASVALSARVGADAFPDFNTEGWVDGETYIPGTPEFEERVLVMPLTQMSGVVTLSVNVSNRPCELLDNVTTLEPTYYDTFDDDGKGLITENTEWEVRCKMPPGQGRGLLVSLARNGQLGGTFLLNYKDPEVSFVSTTSAIPTDITVPTTGYTMTVRGSNFGETPTLNAGPAVIRTAAAVAELGLPASSPVFLTHSHTEVTFVMPDGEGTGVSLVGGAGWTVVMQYPGRSSEGSDPVPFRFEPPTITNVAYTSASTEGGDLVTVTGTNFGAGTLGYNPTVLIDGLPCVDVTFTAAHTQVTCLAPTGTGSDLDLTIIVSEQSATMSGAYSYDIPVIGGLQVPTARRLGGGPLHRRRTQSGGALVVGTSGGANLTITGSNFGVRSGDNCVFVTWAHATETPVCDGVETFEGEGEVPAAFILEHTHTKIVVQAPPGMGDKKVTVFVRNQISPTPADPNLVYAGPVLLDLTPDHGPTLGGTELVLRGTNLGFSVLTVPVYPVALVDDDGHPAWPAVPGQSHLKLSFSSRCFTPGTASLPPLSSCAIVDDQERPVVLSHNHTHIVFRGPGGIGVNRTVTMALFDEADFGSGGVAAPNGVQFSYDPPEITFVDPNNADALGDEIRIFGKNFGLQKDLEQATDEERFVAVVVSGLTCVDAGRQISRAGDTALTCTTVDDPVGYKNVSISVAGQNSTLLAPDDRFFTTCKPGSYGQVGEYCLPCPRGATCAGEYAEPVSDPGWWVLNATCSDAFSDNPEALAKREHRAKCNYAVPCFLEEACLGDNTCATGYVSRAPNYRCGACAERYFKRGAECVPCPDNPWILIVAFVIVAIAACVMAFVLNRKRVSIALLSIGIDYFQVLSIFATSRVEWPPLLQDIYTYLSAFNFNLEITAPECTIPDVDFTEKFLAFQAFPIAAILLLAVIHVVLVLYKRIILCRRRKLARHWPALVATALTIFYVLYLALARLTLEVFNCGPTTPDVDGKHYLQVVDEECWIDGGVQMTLLPYALIALTLYVIGFPALLFGLLYRNRFNVMLDQVLRAMGRGDTRANPAYEVRKRLSRMYYAFRPPYYYWAVVVTLRKFMLAVSALMFNRNVAFQLSMSLLVMFAAYAIQVRFQPFMSPSEFQDELKRVEDRAASSAVTMDAKLMDRVKGVQAAARRQGVTATMDGSRRRATTRATAYRVANFLNNWNTVEATLLFSAVLVNLSGIMFESGRFEDDQFSEQRDVITYLILLVIVASILYYLTVLVLEVRAALNKGRLSKNSKKGKGGKARKSMTAEVMVTPDSVMQNPMLSKSAAIAGAGAGAGAGSRRGSVAGGGVPDADTWAAFQANHEAALEELKSLRKKMQTAQLLSSNSREKSFRAGPNRTRQEFRRQKARALEDETG